MRFERPRPKNDEERILPLINVVFLLLIFFMIAGRLAASDPFEIAPPHSASEGRADSRETVVLVGAEGQLALNGEVMSGEELKAALTERLENDAAGQVWVKADGAADSTRVVEITEMIRDSGVRKLKLMTVPVLVGGAS